jgi:hypothetical protein
MATPDECVNRIVQKYAVEIGPQSTAEVRADAFKSLAGTVSRQMPAVSERLGLVRQARGRLQLPLKRLVST